MRIVTIALMLACFTFGGCKKCYQCTGKNAWTNTNDVCKGNPSYSQVQKNNGFHDENGKWIECN